MRGLSQLWRDFAHLRKFQRGFCPSQRWVKNECHQTKLPFYHMVAWVMYRGMVKLSLIGLHPHQSYALMKVALSRDGEIPVGGGKNNIPIFQKLPKWSKLDPVEVERHSITHKPCDEVHSSTKTGSIPSLRGTYPSKSGFCSSQRWVHYWQQ